MKIGYDGKRAANNTTGLGNYSRSLIEHLAAQFPQHQYFIFTPKIKASIAALDFFKLPNVLLKLPEATKLFWRSFGITNQLVKDQINIFHGLSHEIPFGLKKNGIKTVVTIHDLIFLRYPNYYKFIDRTIYQLKSKFACNHADKIIAISQKTKDDIIEFYGISPEKIAVIYQSCDDSFKTTLPANVKEEVRLKHQLPTKYILSVGTIEERKNLLLLIKALPQINSAYTLVVVGKETPYATLVKKEIEKLGLQQRVIFLQNVPFKDLPAIYQLASAFIYPSLYEGFGIPIIEALYSSTPVIAAKGSCLEEAGGPYSKYIAPDNAQELAKVTNQVLNDTALQSEMIKNGLNFVQRFNNNIVSKQVMDCYLNILAK